jgi:hypothetical protein
MDKTVVVKGCYCLPQQDGENVCQCVLVGWLSGLGFVFVIPLAKPTLLLASPRPGNIEKTEKVL